jgi:hypothetical protein
MGIRHRNCELECLSAFTLSPELACYARCPGAIADRVSGESRQTKPDKASLPGPQNVAPRRHGNYAHVGDDSVQSTHVSGQTWFFGDGSPLQFC